MQVPALQGISWLSLTLVLVTQKHGGEQRHEGGLSARRQLQTGGYLKKVGMGVLSSIQSTNCCQTRGAQAYPELSCCQGTSIAKQQKALQT